MPYVRIWVHLVFSTKNREKLIFRELREKLIEHIKSNAKTKGIWIDSINCTDDHVYVLLSLGTEQSVSKVAMLIKGESSYWINKNKLTSTKFEWQDEYYAASLSESLLKNVREYILNQGDHHKNKSFSDEYTELITQLKEINS